MLVKRDLGESFYLLFLFGAFVLFRQVVCDLAIGKLKALLADLGLYDMKNLSCAARATMTVRVSFGG